MAAAAMSLATWRTVSARMVVVVEVAGHVVAVTWLRRPGVEGVVDERGPLQQPVVVGLDVEPAEPDGEQPRSERVGVELVVDVGGVHDGGQTDERWIGPESEVVDEHLERAAAVTVVELGARRVEAVRVLVAGRRPGHRPSGT